MFYQVVVNGEIRIGGQEHFYLEPQASLVIPGEAGHFEVLASSQALTDIQHLIASVCGVAYMNVKARLDLCWQLNCLIRACPA